MEELRMTTRFANEGPELSLEIEIGIGSLPSQVHVVLIDFLAGASLSVWAATSVDIRLTLRDALHSMCPSRVELSFAEHSRIYGRCVKMTHSGSRDQEFGAAIGQLEHSMEPFMLCWQAIDYVHQLLLVMKRDGNQLLPAVDDSFNEYDEPPAPFDLRLRKFFKELRTQQLEYIEHIGIDVILRKVEEFSSKAKALGACFCRSISAELRRLDSIPSSSLERQVSLANAMRDVRGFGLDFADIELPGPNMFDSVRHRAAEADMLWNQWDPSPQQVAFAAVVAESQEGVSLLSRVLKCTSATYRTESPTFEASYRTESGQVVEYFIEKTQVVDDSVVFGEMVSDWAVLVRASTGETPTCNKQNDRLKFGSPDTILEMDLQGEPLIPKIIGGWPNREIALSVRPATAEEAMQLLQCGSGMKLPKRRAVHGMH